MASWFAKESRACSKSLRRSSSGTPSRYMMYSAMMRTLSTLLQKCLCKFHVHINRGRELIPNRWVIQQGYHLFYKRLGSFSLRGHTSRAVLECSDSSAKTGNEYRKRSPLVRHPLTPSASSSQKGSYILVPCSSVGRTVAPLRQIEVTNKY